jgi:thiamine biosynthesis lipoprotein ApbE
VLYRQSNTLDTRPLETQIVVVGDPALIERGHERLRRLRAVRPPGLAVDDVVDDLEGCGATGVLVQLGGIVRVTGHSPGGQSWLIVVAHPRGHFATAVLRLDSGAVATVSRPGRTGRPSDDDDLLAVSVVAGQAWEAELLAATALAAGAAGAEQMLRSAELPALLINDWDEGMPVGDWGRLSAASPASETQPRLLASSL